jgi:SAM-dependent methyltransferase
MGDTDWTRHRDALTPGDSRTSGLPDHAPRYATTTRPEVRKLMPNHGLRFLDVGCNDGGFGEWLMAQDPRREVWGIEPDAEQAQSARNRGLANVVTGTFDDARGIVPTNFDCVSFNHVLEHLVDPWTALDQTRCLMAPGACIIAVIPNIRYLPFMIDLALRGRFDYRDSGLLDRTHLRFFTRRSIQPLFEVAGLEIEQLFRVNGIASDRFPRLSRVLGGFFGDSWYGAFAVRARLLTK